MMKSGSTFSALTIVLVAVAIYITYHWSSMDQSGSTHSMGHVVHNFSIASILPSEIMSLRQLVTEHGVIVTRNDHNDEGDASLSSQDLLAFAAKFGEPIKLPNGFGFNSSNAQDTDSFIHNITNLDPVSGTPRNTSFAEYLHNDGDFWQQHYIFTFAIGDIIPEIGGNTQFIDLHSAHNHLLRSQPEVFEAIQGRRVVSDVYDIPDFVGSPFLDEFNVNYETAKHNLVAAHAVSKQPHLYYACKHAVIEGLSADESQRLLFKVDELLLGHAALSYVHEWKQSDLVIWDNTRVMHRSMGGYFKSARKLWRVQSRMSN